MPVQGGVGGGGVGGGGAGGGGTGGGSTDPCAGNPTQFSGNMNAPCSPVGNVATFFCGPEDIEGYPTRIYCNGTTCAWTVANSCLAPGGPSCAGCIDDGVCTQSTAPQCVE